MDAAMPTQMVETSHFLMYHAENCRKSAMPSVTPLPARANDKNWISPIEVLRLEIEHLRDDQRTRSCC